MDPQVAHEGGGVHPVPLDRLLLPSGRNVFRELQARHRDPVEDSLPPVEQIVFEDVNWGIAGFASGDVVKLKVWLDYGD